MVPASSGGAPDTGWAAAVLAVVAKPRLWRPALRSIVAFVPRAWWRRRPWLPVPDGAFLRFRMNTAFGPDAGAPPAPELVSYLRWIRAWPRIVER